MANGVNKQVIQVGGGGEGSGDMTKAVYDVNDSGYVDSAHKILLPFINKLGSTVTKGTIVVLKSTSSSANYPEIVKANASTEAYSSKTVGAVYEDVADSATGYLVTNGEVHNLDTSGYSVGDSLWLATTDGLVTTTQPSSPDHSVYIGRVTRSQATNGRIHYDIQNGYELGELHDVSFTSLANDDFIQRKAGLWVNRTITQVLTDVVKPGSFTANFGNNTTGIYYVTVTVTDANVTPTSKPVISLYNAGSRDADEIEMVDLKCSVSSVGTGTFDVYVTDGAMQAEGSYNFNYSLI